MTSLATLRSDPKFRSDVGNKDPLFDSRLSYFLPGKALKADVKCCSEICTWETRYAAGNARSDASGPLYQPMLLCYCCNRTYHLQCLGLDLEAFEAQIIPWVCQDCSDNPHNTHAVGFYKSNEWIHGLAKRRELLLTSQAVTDKPKLLKAQDSTDEYDSSDIEAFKRTSEDTQYVTILEFDKQKAEAEQIASKLIEVASERDELIEKIKQLEAAAAAQKTQPTQPSFLHPDISFNTPSSTFRDTLPPKQQAPPQLATPRVFSLKDVMSQIYLNQSQRQTSSSHASNSSNASGAGQSRPERSFVNDIDASKLNSSERVLLEHTSVQREATDAQRIMSTTMVLEQKRKSLPKIASFSGDARDWIRFKRDVKRYEDVGKYDEDLMKMYILRALEGEALDRVADMIDTMPIELTMGMLEKTFGDATAIIDKCGEDIMAIKLSGELYKDDVIKIVTKIQRYFAACIHGEISCANSNILAKHVVDQLSTEVRQRYRKYRREEDKDGNKLMTLETLFSFLEEMLPDLDDRKSKPAQVIASTSFVPHSNNSNHSNNPNRANHSNTGNNGKPKPESYIIRDVKEARFLGYDTAKLTAFEKKCAICSQNHYTVECKNYFKMDKDKRNQIVNSRQICRNCIVTSTHKAPECTLKPQCGARLPNSTARCSGRHHVSLHTHARPGGNRNFGYHRRNNTNNNGNRASSILANASETPANMVDSAISSAASANQVQSRLQNTIRQNSNSIVAVSASCDSSANESQQGSTVKVFKTRFFGEEEDQVGFAVGDSASETTLLNEDLRRALNINGEKCQINVRWTDSTAKTINAIKVDLQIRGLHRNAKKLTLHNCYAVSTDDFCLPPRSLNLKLLKKRYPYLKPVKCDGYSNIVPSLLIGSRHAAFIESCGTLLEGGEGKPVGLLAKLGWCVYGGNPIEIGSHCVANVQMDSNEKIKETAMSNDELFDIFSFFNSVENLGLREKQSRHTEDEAKAIEIMEEEMRILPNGAIEVPLIWNRHNKRIPHLPNNFNMVMKRQLTQELKLQKNPEHLKIYNDKFKELIADGYVRPALESDLNGRWLNENYLPMTLVCNNNKTPPSFRIVFDAAAKYQQTSLNMNLLKGPDLLINIFEPLINMRTREVAFTADVKAMFMRMKVNLRDQQCQRVLWRESSNDEMKVFIFSSVLFGPTCSPFQSQFCKNLVADAWQDLYPKAAQTIRELVYMDDLLTSSASTQEAIELSKQCIHIFKSIDWELRQFQSNDLQLLKNLPTISVKQDTISLVEEFDKICTAKVLGIMWDTTNDNFIFNFDKNLFIRIVQECQHKPTKRDQSSTIARIFDVLGLICHFVIRGRILLQRSWANGLDWDETIGDEDHKQWLLWLNEIKNIASLKIPRKLCQANDLWQTIESELHIFCDAGAEAYAAVAYLVTLHNNKRTSNIVMARAHVTPLRYKSKTNISEIPRLELYAALLGARLCDTIIKNFANLTLSRYLWTDSEVVLRWISNPNMQLKAYAVSPIEEILTKTDKKEWFYVPSKLNVADTATKFKKFDFGDSNSVWFKGPDFLKHDKQCWPTSANIPKKFEQEKSETAPAIVCNMSVQQIEFKSTIKLPDVDDIIANEYCISNLSASTRSTWIKLVRATARGLKIWMDGFLPLVISKSLHNQQALAETKAKNFSILTPYDLDRAELFLARRAQRESFPDEYAALKAGKIVENREMKELNVFLDDQGVIRINSRVKLCQNLYPQQFAPLLPKENAYTSIFLKHVHCEYQHIHLETQIAAVRSKYWVPMLRVKLKSIKHKCNHCAYMRALPYAPMMAPLPTCRTDPDQFPFQVTGVDCAGPIMVKIWNRPKKIWILIFSCTRTRFIQLHILESLESIRVLEAIAVLVSTNGPVQTFISDRGTNFQGASRFIREEYERTKNALFNLSQDLANQVSQKYRIEWKFIPAHSPWMGGFYERLIREVKRSIIHALENKSLTKIQLNIALQDACHRINCRPLTHNSIEAEDADILTPHHLARGRPGWPYLPGLAPLEPPNLNKDRSIFRRSRILADEITRKFVHGYLEVLTKRTKWFTDKTKPLQIGDLVLLIEPNLTRRQWRRGKVIKIYKSSDRRGRVADILIKDGDVKLARSVQRLAKLNISHDDVEA